MIMTTMRRERVCAMTGSVLPPLATDQEIFQKHSASGSTSQHPHKTPGTCCRPINQPATNDDDDQLAWRKQRNRE
jgi:hypothetical protein